VRGLLSCVLCVNCLSSPHESGLRSSSPVWHIIFGKKKKKFEFWNARARGRVRGYGESERTDGLKR
jgi:hypothetical protein